MQLNTRYDVTITQQEFQDALSKAIKDKVGFDFQYKGIQALQKPTADGKSQEVTGYVLFIEKVEAVAPTNITKIDS